MKRIFIILAIIGGIIYLSNMGIVKYQDHQKQKTDQNLQLKKIKEFKNIQNLNRKDRIKSYSKYFKQEISNNNDAICAIPPIIEFENILKHGSYQEILIIAEFRGTPEKILEKLTHLRLNLETDGINHHNDLPYLTQTEVARIWTVSIWNLYYTHDWQKWTNNEMKIKNLTIDEFKRIFVKKSFGKVVFNAMENYLLNDNQILFIINRIKSIWYKEEWRKDELHKGIYIDGIWLDGNWFCDDIQTDIGYIKWLRSKPSNKRKNWVY